MPLRATLLDAAARASHHQAKPETRAFNSAMDMARYLERGMDAPGVEIVWKILCRFSSGDETLEEVYSAR